MLDYISVRNAAKKWGISERRIQVLCNEEDAVSFGHAWDIPKYVPKPTNSR